MTTEQNQTLSELRAQTALLATIANTLQKLAQASAPLSPNYRRKLSEYLHFDWSEINAVVSRANHDGYEAALAGLREVLRQAGAA